MSWRAQAACAGEPVNKWFPELGSRRDDPKSFNSWRPALRVCARCPVRRECLTEALGWEEPHYSLERGKWLRSKPSGIWGGQGESSRHEHSIVHLSTCQGACRGCRPISERVELLEARFKATAWRRGLLARREQIA